MTEQDVACNRHDLLKRHVMRASWKQKEYETKLRKIQDSYPK